MTGSAAGEAGLPSLLGYAFSQVSAPALSALWIGRSWASDSLSATSVFPVRRWRPVSTIADGSAGSQDLTMTLRSCVALLLLITTCSGVPNTFAVDVSEAPGTTASLALCGEHAALKLSGATLRITRPITCEGEGDVRLKLKDGSSVICHVGYVTPGAEQSFRWRVHKGACEAILD